MRRLQQRLAIWMNGIPVGYWEKRKGEDRLEYHPDWIADSQGRPLSLQLHCVRLAGDEMLRPVSINTVIIPLITVQHSLSSRLTISQSGR